MSEKMVLPPGWEDERLGDFVFYQKGKKPKNISKSKSEYYNLPYVNIKAFEKNLIDEYTDGVGCIPCERNDFLMVWDGARSGYVGKAIAGVLGSTLVKIQFPGIFIEYAYLFLQSKFLQINTKAKGTGIPHVDPNLLWNYRFPIPPLAEQHRIVAKIEVLFSSLDKGIESLKTAQAQLKTYRQAVLKWAFEGKLTNENVKDGKLPEGWKWVDFGSLFKGTPQNGLYKPSSEYGSGTPILRIDGFYNGQIVTDYDFKRVRLSSDEISKYLLSPDDIVVNRVNSMSYLGKCGLVKTLKEKTVFESNVMKIQLDFQIAVPRFATYYLSSLKGIKELTKNAKQAVNQASINQTDVANAQIPLPPLPEQALIVAEIEKRLSVCDKLEESITQSLSQAEALRQSILKKAFEGKLVPQDLSDEPASVLLERIRAERASSTPVKKARTPKEKK